MTPYIVLYHIFKDSCSHLLNTVAPLCFIFFFSEKNSAGVMKKVKMNKKDIKKAQEKKVRVV